MKNNINLFFLLTLGTFLTISCDNAIDDTDTNEVNSSLLASKLGVWEGVGMQPPNLTWTIRITLNENEQLIEYPSLNCGGFWTLINEDKDNNSLLFRETINFGSGCVDQGFVELIETSPTTMDYNYFFPNASNEQGTLGATGQITKTN